MGGQQHLLLYCCCNWLHWFLEPYHFIVRNGPQTRSKMAQAFPPLVSCQKLASMLCHFMRVDSSTVEKKTNKPENRFSSSIFAVCRYFLIPYVCHRYFDVNENLRHCTCNSRKLDAEDEAFLNVPIDLYPLYILHILCTSFKCWGFPYLVNFACIFENTLERVRNCPRKVSSLY